MSRLAALYVEEAIADSPRVERIVAKHPGVPVIHCQQYGEIFNRHGQSFRLQKGAPALILARKEGRLVLPAPSGYGFTADTSFYFSHMLNCVYDCRYCFLQGMYRSAHYVLFCNYEEFAEQIREISGRLDSPLVFYSGYDCDSLAFEPITEFVDYFLPLFAGLDKACLELRTKSTQVRRLLHYRPMSNCVIAMSFTSESIGEHLEHRVPDLDKRLLALRSLQQAGWPVAIRFEPVIPEPGALAQFRALFARVFAALDAGSLHSVSLGEFRMPTDYHRRISRLYPDEPLFARSVLASDGVCRLAGGTDLVAELELELAHYIRPEQYYRCAEAAA